MGIRRDVNWTPEERFLRDFATHVRHIEQQGVCEVQFAWHTTARLGVLCWHMEVREPSLFDDAMVARVRVVKEFPNGDHTSLAGFLFAQACKLGVLYDEYRAGTGPAQAPAAH